MLKKIAVDYFRAYSRRGIRERWKTNGGELAGMIGMIYPLIVALFQMDSDEKIICLLVCLPMLYNLFSLYMHPVGLCKMMYLCPMEPDERRRYIRSSYRFGILVRMSVAVIGVGAVMMFYDCSVIAVTEILLNDLVLSLLIPSRKSQKEGYGAILKETVCMICMIVVSMLSNFILVLAASDQDPGNVMIIILAGIVLIQLPLTIGYQKYVRSELETAVYYENLSGDNL